MVSDPNMPPHTEFAAVVRDYAEFWNEPTLRLVDVLQIAGLKRTLFLSWKKRGFFKVRGEKSDGRALYSPRDVLELTIMVEGARSGLPARTVWNAINSRIDAVILDRVRYIALSADKCVPYESSDVVDWFPDSAVVSLIKVAEIRDAVWRRVMEHLGKLPAGLA